MKRRKAVSKVTQLKHAKEELQKVQQELELVKLDVQKFQEFFIKEYKLHLSCLEKKEHLNTETAIKRYSVHLNKVQPFYTGL